MEFDETATNLSTVAPKLTKLVPVRENILVQVGELDTAAQLRAIGLTVPDIQKDKPNNGTILSVGDKVTSLLKAGQKILFTKYGGTSFNFEGQDLLILSQDDVICFYQEA
jgi:chaperonin GroES